MCRQEIGKRTRRLVGGTRKFRITNRKQDNKNKWDTERTEDIRQGLKEMQREVKVEVAKST